MDGIDQPPTEYDWANTDVEVIRLGEPPNIGLKKELTKQGVAHTQIIWLTIPQLRSLAIEETF